MSGLKRRWAIRGKEAASAMVWSPDGRRLAVVNQAGHVLVLDGDSGDVLVQAVAHPAGALCAAWSGAGEVWTAGQDGRLLRWSGGEPAVVADGARWFGGLVAGAGWIAVAMDRQVRFFDAGGGEVPGGGAHPATVASLAADPRSGGVVSASYGGGWVWKPNATPPVDRFDFKGSMLAVAAASGGRWVAFGAQDASTVVWDRNGGPPLRMSGYGGKVELLAWGAGGTLVTAGGATVAAWTFVGDGPAGEGGQELSGHEGRVRGVAFGRYGRSIISVGEDGRLIRWSGAAWVTRQIDEVRQSLLGLAVRPDGRRLAAATIEGAVATWDVD